MRWRSGRRSVNVEDRRGSGGFGGFGRSGRGVRVGGIPVVGGGLGLLILLVLALLLGINPLTLLEEGPVGPIGPGYEQQDNLPSGSAGQDERVEFVSVVLADTEDTWRQLYPQAMGGTYRDPTLVLFDGAVRSACGMAGSAVGPFYCPLDEKVYLDLRFFDDLSRSLGAPGDFAQAYVIAHEIGHHVQRLAGISDQVQELQSRLPKDQANKLSVRLELQADCFAGVWGYHAQAQRDLLEPGDLEEALNAASRIGDDRLQRQSQGYVVPDSFTHGTSAQRVRWFRRGFESGDPGVCDTFSVDEGNL